MMSATERLDAENRLQYRIRETCNSEWPIEKKQQQQQQKQQSEAHSGLTFFFQWLKIISDDATVSHIIFLFLYLVDVSYFFLLLSQSQPILMSINAHLFRSKTILFIFVFFAGFIVIISCLLSDWRWNALLFTLVQLLVISFSVDAHTSVVG